MSQDSGQVRARFLSMIDGAAALPVGPAFACPYLPDRHGQNRAFLADRFDPQLYQHLMERGFRRSGTLFYQPACQGCRECRAIRVPVDRFTPSRSQRRVWRRNDDVSVTVGRPLFSPEKYDLYVRYLDYQHDDTMSDSEDDARRFLYESPVHTLEFCYRVGDRLIGVGIADLSSAALSSVYFMFDPADARRSLGTFSALWEIAWTRRRSIPYYYLGFYVRDCRKMNYKARFQPCQILGDHGQWHLLNDAVDRSAPRPRDADHEPLAPNLPSAECH